MPDSGMRTSHKLTLSILSPVYIYFNDRVRQDLGTITVFLLET